MNLVTKSNKTPDGSEKVIVTEEQYQSGFTWRVGLAIVYSALIIQPSAIYLYFVTNQWFIGAVLNTTIVLFAVFAKLADNPLSKQEVFIMINVTSTALGMEMIVALVYNYYLRHHPITKSTLIDGIPLTDLIPDWFAPDFFGPIQTVISPLFIFPLALLILSALLAKSSDISLGIIFNYLYTKVEVLPFPTAEVEAERSKSLTWEDKRKLQVFSVSAIIASVLGFILYFFPLVMGFSIIPIPWFDFNPTVEGILPGASFGIATDLIYFVTGFILPMYVVVSILIGSVLVSIVINPILAASGEIRWEKGMSLIDTFNTSYLDFWIPWSIGLLISASLIPVLRNPKIFIITIRDLRKLSRGEGEELEGGTPKLSILISFFLLGTIGSVFATVVIIPNISLQIIVILLILTVGWSFISSLAMAYTLGITANLPNILYVKESAFVLANVPRGAELWFIPTLVISQGGASWVATFKTSDLTFTKRGSLIKAHLIASFVAWGVGVFWVSALLSIAQVPSVIFPVPFWPLDVGRTVAFVSDPFQVLDPPILAITFILALILYIIEWGTPIPISVISIAVGTTQLYAIPYAVTTFLGALFARVLRSRMENWETDKSIIVAGIGAGLGVTISLATFISLIMNTIALPL